MINGAAGVLRAELDGRVASCGVRLGTMADLLAATKGAHLNVLDTIRPGEVDVLRD